MNVQERYTLWCTSPLVDEESKKSCLLWQATKRRSRTAFIRNCPSVRRGSGAFWAPATTG